MHPCRDLNVATSRSVFAGPYITSKEEEEKFGTAFLHMTEGFLALPICIPGTAVWKAKKGRLYILGVLEKAAAKSKAAMKVCYMLSMLLAALMPLTGHIRQCCCWCASVCPCCPECRGRCRRVIACMNVQRTKTVMASSLTFVLHVISGMTCAAHKVAASYLSA